MEKKIISVELFFEREKVNKKRNIYQGGVEKPDYINELQVEIYEDYDFNDQNDEFEFNGKHNIQISGTSKSLYELGRYLINIAEYETMDKDFHTHLDGVCNSKEEKKYNIIVRKIEM